MKHKQIKKREYNVIVKIYGLNKEIDSKIVSKWLKGLAYDLEILPKEFSDKFFIARLMK